MRRIIKFFFISVFLLAACQPGLATIPVSTTAATLALSATPSQTETPAPPTLTPLPTIPTFTPTFDARAISTVTPAPQAVCPKENPEIVPDFPVCDARGLCDIVSNDDILNYLNSGGALDRLANPSQRVIPDLGDGRIVDLTDDSLKELVIRGLARFYIAGCKDGKYQNLFESDDTAFTIDLEEVADLNKNGIPEIIFASFDRRGPVSIYIYEWDGSTFRSLIRVQPDAFDSSISDSVSTVTKYNIKDTNGDGLKEIVVVDDTLANDTDRLPYFNETIILGWDGQHYVNLQLGNYQPPKYRFQATEQGDRETLYGNYQKALALYQEAIFSDKLEWWSFERIIYGHQIEDNPGTVYPTPIPDRAEYYRLAAYAYYRVIILHVDLGEVDAAEVKYATLHEKFPVGNPGHPYVEMASAFWDAYQSTQKMYNACAAAIAYADAHPEILVPLGSGYHGWQSHIYIPADVCPFR